MPVVLSQFTNDEIDVRYKEEFLTESLNTKVGGNILHSGIHAGYELTTAGVALSVTITDGNANTESRAVVTSGDGQFGLTLRRSGNLIVDLSSKINTTVAICLYGNYTSAGTTTAEIRAYEVSPVNELAVAPERNDLAILGQVVVPAAGNILGTSINADLRTHAADFRLYGQRPLRSLLQNPAFTFAAIGPNSGFSLNAPPWESSTTNAARQVIRGSNTNFPPLLGQDRYLIVDVLNPFQSASVELWQYNAFPFLEGGSVNKGRQQIWIYGVIQVNVAADGGSTGEIFVDFMNGNGDIDSQTVTIPIDITTPGFYFIQQTVVAPVSNITRVAKIGFRTTNAIYTGHAAAAEAIDIYYLQAQINPIEWLGLTDHDLQLDQIFTVLRGSKAALFDPASFGSSFSPIPGDAQAMLMEFLAQGTANSNPLLKLLRLDRTDEDNTNDGVSLEMRGHIEQLGAADVLNGLRDVPAIQTTFSGTNEMTLFWEAEQAAPGGLYPHPRIYASFQGQMWFTMNAYFDAGASLWRKDVAGESTAVMFTNANAAGFRFFWQRDTPIGTTWVSSDWVETARFGAQDLVGGIGPGLISAGGPPTTGLDGTGVGLNDLLIPRFSAQHDQAGNYTLLFESREYDPAQNQPLRIYFGESFTTINTQSNRGLVITINAFYDNDTGAWEADLTTEESSKLYFNRNNFSIVARGAGAGTWFDFVGAGGWDKNAFDIGGWVFTGTDWVVGGDLPGDDVFASRFRMQLDSTPEISFRNGRILLGNRDSTGADIPVTIHTNPSPTAFVINNGLYAKNIVKAWGFITTGGGGPSEVEGFNLANHSYTGTDLQCAIGQDMNTADYAVVAMTVRTTPLILSTRNMAVGGFQIRANTNAGAIVDLSASIEDIMYIVIGPQD